MFGLLFVNMFVGVIVETFNREKEQLSLNLLLSKEQKYWIITQNMTYKFKMVTYIKEGTESFIRDICIRFTNWRWFETIIMVFIVLNTMILALKWLD